ncbi:hypothetical protein BBL91_09210 [Vibrio parahaemolyticus]|uniref:Uncharacterized protein n=1 Tax=Vibrio parahaemolyticus TaxID=670 RepID=A0A7M1WH94_VIBPH|nr:hypothetical protein Y011_20405 [Vibrio parahaemolyticus VP49]KOE96796.1 hypothetical protein ACS88_01220 [Vibrio parahaemolyticus]ODW69845.1 hypothetical protein BBL91_09210 [Vibrio parahaemolyticus]QOS26349.1 hypothetical protein VP366_00017 [Vibrio parahaemolyticus]
MNMELIFPNYGLKGSFQMQQKKIFYNSQSYTYLMDNSVSIDIDHKLDFELAEFVLNKYGHN